MLDDGSMCDAAAEHSTEERGYKRVRTARAAVADRFWKIDWPGSARPGVFYDPRALEQDGPSGVLHAKAVVTDDEAVFVTSANLTEAALDRNIELGLLVRDRTLAASVSSHFRGLIDRGLLRPLPVM
jgi:phosphatidylserine/phosphatidylglycerophosphate/cardiolipin synthase-like enzyme